MSQKSGFPANYPFAPLVGTWSNQTLPNATNNQGSESNPLSYNIMPLPQDSSQDELQDSGYILKNFTYYETLNFNDQSAVSAPANAPNRGGNYMQNAFALFYDQQVHFAEGPAEKQIVHEENGSWLYLSTAPQFIGPYALGDNPPVESGKVLPQPPDIQIAKQMSVPHGNSILALGSISKPTTGQPNIPNASAPFPTPAGLPTTPYTTQLSDPNNYQNPQPDLTLQPNAPLQQAIELIQPNAYIHWRVTTERLDSGQGAVTNIPFEQRKANVSTYFADYWLLSTDGGSSYNYLSYSQTILMQLSIHGKTGYTFPHITCNTLTKV